MHGPINVKFPNNTSKWQMGFNSTFKGLIYVTKFFQLYVVEFRLIIFLLPISKKLDSNRKCSYSVHNVSVAGNI